MPNYARQSSLDLDEIFGHYIKNDSNAAMMRNIRTKERMSSAVGSRDLGTRLMLREYTDLSNHSITAKTRSVAAAHQ